MSDRCQLCGSPVRVVTEGTTSHYEPVAPRLTGEDEELAKWCEAHAGKSHSIIYGFVGELDVPEKLERIAARLRGQA